MKEDLKLKHLQSAFPKLTETNQFYVLGLAEGFKYVQQSSGSAHQNKKFYRQGEKAVQN